MIERTPILDAVTHVLMLVGLILAALPIWIVFVASTHDLPTVNRVPMPLWPGSDMVENYARVWQKARFGEKMVNSLIVAAGVTAGKIALAAISAFSIVFFRYRGRMLMFWLIFVTLMLPLEVRIVPTYAVASNVLEPFHVLFGALGISVGLPQVNLLNTYTGLVLPLVATATGTFLYRQFFMTIPDELAEAAKMDGAGPILLRHPSAAVAHEHGGARDDHVRLCLEPVSLAAAHRHRSIARDRDDDAPEDRSRPAVRPAADLERGHGRDAAGDDPAAAGGDLHAGLLRARPGEHREMTTRGDRRWLTF
jgi:ABC-type glycerol-3-phosphate transport system permease component